MFDAVIIGAGHAGLASAKLLADKGFDKVLVVEADKAVGAKWRSRYNGLSLFTSREYSALPGLLMLGDQDGYPSKDEFADYLTTYQARFNIGVRFNSKVELVTKKTAGFSLKLSNGEQIMAQRVFICTGAFQTPLMPAWSSYISDKVVVYTSQTVPDTLWQSHDQDILIVGDGASGRQLAASLVSQHKVTLACGKKRTLLPQRVLGKDVFFWLDKLNLLWLSKHNLIAKWLARRDPFPGSGLSLKSLAMQGVKLISRVEARSDKGFFSAQARLTPSVVIMCLGYRNSWPFLKQLLSDIEHNDEPIEALMAAYPGLYFLSQPWLSCRASGLIMGIEHDFKRLNI